MTISFHDISKKFAQNTEREVAALGNITFDIEENEFVSLVGPNGCGKTTLLRIVAGLIKPDSGYISYPPGMQNPNAIMVFQDQGLLPWLTVRKNIGLGLELQKAPKSSQKSQVQEFMKRVKLEGFGDHYPHELSGGMRQRVALARAFLTDPDIMLMDEPFGALDAQTRLILQEELLHIWRTEQKTVLFVTHDIDEAILLSDRIIVLTNRPGRIQRSIKIPLARPRELKIKDHPKFVEIKWEIWNLLEKEVRKDLQLT
jgi:NitT/TauT family transport system ATP-binding protein